MSEKTRAGSRVRLARSRGGEVVRCEGCRQDFPVTGVGSARAAVAQHARRCPN